MYIEGHRRRDKPKIVHVQVSYNGECKDGADCVQGDGKKIMRRVQTDKKPEPRACTVSTRMTKRKKEDRDGDGQKDGRNQRRSRI